MENPHLLIRRNVRTGMRGLVATTAIPAGEILGEYLGHLRLIGAPSKFEPVNEGYRLRLKTKTSSNKYAGIDALYSGGKLRLLNHSCNPTARFHEVQTGRELTVVAVTARDVFPGEERGRKSGYRNFSIAEQMPLCSVVGDILPLGRNMWNQVALWYNSRRPRGTSERDFEALRRKFRSLYGKPKPPGYNGEIPESKKPIAFAHKSTESLNSAPELHSTTMALMTVPMMQSCVAPSVDEVVAESEEDENEEIRQEDTQDEDSPPDTDLPDVPPAQTYTQKSTQASVAASVEDSVDEWVSDREERADSTSTTENVQTLGTNLDFVGPETPIPSSASQGRAAPFTAGPRAPTSCANASSTRTSGRPRRPSREHIPSEATPDGPVLNRDPDNELADSNEMARSRLTDEQNKKTNYDAMNDRSAGTLKRKID
ncbi:hypothetical protein F442_19363 [Phytophthora nicotianae P10297]|uniref:SET domain-containing protein n=1 Tax=Phytophthora nicotianae P10297 TaxID=1317064 RepID=W2Y9S2_PHYNI|nr:hypothetical protein F442_19363 [Phytophthora nicotianae P10297]